MRQELKVGVVVPFWSPPPRVIYVLPLNIDLIVMESGTFRRGIFPRESCLGAQNTIAMVGGSGGKRATGHYISDHCQTWIPVYPGLK